MQDRARRRTKSANVMTRHEPGRAGRRDFLTAKNIGLSYNSSTSIGYHGVGYDSTSALSGNNAGNLSASSTYYSGIAEFSTQSFGFHYLAAIEKASGSGTAAVGIGDNNTPTFNQTGFSVSGFF